MSEARPRTIVTADPELDDLNSMIRLLLHSNDMAIEGLIYASSRFHWKGDGEGTLFFLPEREYDTPQTSCRWAPGERFIHDVVDAYEQVHPNLVVHDPRYPSADELRSVIRDGNIAFEGDTSTESPGSQLIADALLDDRPGPIHLQVWAGTSTIARALMSIEERYASEPGWEDLHQRVSEKAVITKFASQDETYEDYIHPRWPGIRVTDVASRAWGYLARSVVLPQDLPLLSADWLAANVTSVGPLGALYRVWGDGLQMVPGDVTDYFHLSGHTADELRELGYIVWVEPQPAGEWISEGDTTNLLNLVANGLRGHEYPGFGGWGGRAAPVPERANEWLVSLAEDAAPDDGEAPEYSVTRWFADAQRDFAARLRWSVTPDYAGANHHPELAIGPALDLTGLPGESLELVATASDPDGDAVGLRWWHYAEAGTCPAPVEIDGPTSSTVRLRLPAGATAGQTVHLICEARDNADLPLVTYARVIITIAE